MGFGLTTIVIPKIGIRATDLEFETHPARVGGGEIVVLGFSCFGKIGNTKI